MAVEAGRMALRSRRAVQSLLALEGPPGQVAFMPNATTALNTALWGVLRRGDRLVVTAYDHNAVLRPAHFLANERGVEVSMLSGTPDGTVDLDALEALLVGTRLLVVNAASNVLGVRLPLRDMAERAHAAGALVLVDAAQGAGHFPMRCGPDGADLVAFTGHKGMLGPQGTGGLWVREGVEVEPLVRGGSGGDSRLRDMPATMPDRLEAGTLNAPGLVGLEAGIAEVCRMGVEALHARLAPLKRRLREGLAAMPGVTVHSPPAPEGAAIVTSSVRGLSPSVVAGRLEREFGVQVRAGLHCAPEAHRLLGTLDTGAVRFSLGWCSTAEDIERTLEAMDAVGGPRSFAVSGTKTNN